MSDIRVYAHEIPQCMTIELSEVERCMFANLLTSFRISVDVAGDTFQHLYRLGLERIYKEYVKDKRCVGQEY
ncbi:hypothetical protein DNHGIG_31700 [Collibacillus ludicampi]|uniref:Uncharacterized protein n=2 Tax=Collibacillus ludicampi TaxID=2771369 RepID=A0AAV4LID6_9BACL|nr:hypothetical protein DNHGIG_31700 [Collibacillus ludicampi]